MRVLVLVAMAVAMCAVGCAKGEGYVKPGYDFSRVKRVAVVQITGPLEGRAEEEYISDSFKFEFFKRGYDVVERSQVDAILDEQKFQRSGVTTDEGAAEAGRILNVDAVMVANLARYGERITLTSKLIDVETGVEVWMAKGTATTGKTLSTVGGAAAGGALGVALGGDRTGRIVGGVAGATLGGVAGHALSPEREGQLEKVIAEACKTLPYSGAPAVPVP